jgi:phosphatidylinositol 4-kinase
MEEKYQNVNNKTNIETKSNIDTTSGSSLYKIEKLDKLGINNIENEENNDDENIYNVNNKKNISKKCCEFLCNKLFHSNKRSKNFYMKGWRDYLEREGNEASDKPFKILTNLFVNDEEAILGLESIRLNPNLVSENKLRNDLEFYIPQLCTFLLFGEMKDIEEFFVFLCKACNLSFFFAHRVHWFLSAMIEASQEKKENIIQILKMINTLFKSENEENKIKINKFYVSNSEEYIHFIKINNLHFLYNNKNIQKDHVHLIEEFDIENLRGQQLNIYNKYSKAKNIIFKYSEKEYEYAILQNTNISSKDKNINKNDTNEIINLNEDIKREKNKIKFKEKLNANEFLISISNFKLNRIDYSFEDDDNELKNNSENNIPEEEEKKIKKKK